MNTKYDRCVSYRDGRPHGMLWIRTDDTWGYMVRLHNPRGPDPEELVAHNRYFRILKTGATHADADGPEQWNDPTETPCEEIFLTMRYRMLLAWQLINLADHMLNTEESARVAQYALNGYLEEQTDPEIHGLVCTLKQLQIRLSQLHTPPVRLQPNLLVPEVPTGG